ncbi:hypothetical protein [Paraburkholderia fungorum]|uniref:hypothetical protein n=1 Tax=Paraburkholderia fungorum TaxID=134537 RepID=UPI00161AF249|nr:hypothetical protein [Paraburkholderia fungorum]MBB5546584.1 hypothetical protein [Paraburkholderia fungorum]
MNGNNQSAVAEIRHSLGAVAPGMGVLVGAGVSREDRLTSEVDRAAELLRDTFSVAVEKRYNNSGRSGGAYVITDTDARGVGSNRSIGISIGLTGDGGLRFNANVDAAYLHDGTLATEGGHGSMFGPYAYHPVGSVDEALGWIKENATVPGSNGDPLKTWFRDPVGGTCYPSMESVKMYLQEGRYAVPSLPPTIEIKTIAGKVYSLHPVCMDRMPSMVASDWLQFLGAHIAGTTLDEAMQRKIQRFMREFETECLTDHRDYFTMAGGMLAQCDPKPFQRRHA